MQSHQFMKYLQNPYFSYFVYNQVSDILQAYDSHANLSQLADDIAIWCILQMFLDILAI